nr:11076_t:CDS:2 [Entrophospora candida]
MEKIRNESSEITLLTNYIDNIMKDTLHIPDKHVVQWPNTALNESRTRNIEDLIRFGVFMKDCIDSAIDKGTDINVLGFQCVDLILGLYFMIHIGQVSIPASVKEMASFVDEIVTLLTISKIL